MFVKYMITILCIIWPTSGYHQKDSLTQLMLIIAFDFDPKVTRNLVTSLGPYTRFNPQDYSPDCGHLTETYHLKLTFFNSSFF